MELILVRHGDVDAPPGLCLGQTDAPLSASGFAAMQQLAATWVEAPPRFLFSSDLKRAQQAASWKVYKASEPGPSGSSIYVFLIDPVVPDTDYTPSAILAEGFPDDVRPLYKALADSLASLTIFNLSLVSDFSK